MNPVMLKQYEENYITSRYDPKDWNSPNSQNLNGQIPGGKLVRYLFE